MTPEETIEKSRELDRFLTKAKEDLMPPMTNTRSSLTSIKDLMMPVDDAMRRFQTRLQDKAAEMARDIEAHGDLVLRKVDDEHQEALRQFGDLLGNEHPGQTDDVSGKPQGGG